MAKVEETITLLYEWESVEPDPQQFKPGKPSLLPVSQFIEIAIPIRLGVRVDEELGMDRYILSPAAMAYVVNQLKNAMARA